MLLYCNSHCHLHTPQEANARQLISVDVTTEAIPAPSIGTTQFYSVGWHPWYLSEEKLHKEDLRALASREDVKALGECGLDRLASTPLPIQEQALMLQWHIAHELNKPMILHVVRAWSEVLAFRKRVGDEVPMVIHGFRGNAQLAAQLLSHGFFLSFGEHFNQDAAKWVYSAGKMLLESDDSALSISQIYANMAQALCTTIAPLCSSLYEINASLFDFSTAKSRE